MSAALGYAVSQSTQQTPSRADRETQKINFSVFLNYIVSLRTEAQRLQFSGVQFPSSDLFSGCSGNLNRCLFKDIPYYFDSNQLSKKTGIPFDFTDGYSAGMSARMHFRNGRYYYFLIFRNVEENACVAFNASVGISQVKDVVNQWDFDALAANTLELPAQCIRTSADDHHHIIAQIYTSDKV